ncbi:MAG: RNA polymerase sigma factor [Chloroflexota bacterium]|nr:MAG: RNA polymerase sigma factor [Chloroflexota bacterium]
MISPEENAGAPLGIEWMLQSSQVSDLNLIVEILNAYGSDLYRFAQALLEGNERNARVALRQTVLTAVINRRQYWGDEPVRVWLYRLTLQTCRQMARGRAAKRIWARFRKRSADQAGLVEGSDIQFEVQLRQAFDSLPESHRLVLALRHANGLPSSEIARILGSSQARVESLLHHATSRLVRWIKKSGPIDAIADADRDEQRVARTLERLWPANDLTGENQNLAAEIASQVERRQVRRFFSFSARESFLLITVVALVIAVIWSISASDVGDELVRAPHTPTPTQRVDLTRVASVLEFSFTQAPTPAVPTPVTPEAEIVSLNDRSGVGDLMRRMVQSQNLWHTLWADIWVLDYGPAGYVGPPWEYRNQIWVSQPQDIVILAGPGSGKPEYYRVASGNSGYEVILDKNLTYNFTREEGAQASLVYPSLLMSTVDKTFAGPISDNYLPELFFPGGQDWFDSALEVVGSEEIAGRPALIVDWFKPDGSHPARFWLDETYGVILKWREFDPQAPGTVARDILVSQVAFEINFPRGFFDFRGSWVTDLDWGDLWQPPGAADNRYSWIPVDGHRPVEARQAQEDFDDFQSRLTFQWIPQEGQPLEDARVQVLAGESLIGELEVGDPRTIQCERSPNGKYLAIIQDPDRVVYPSGEIRWFSLADIETMHSLLPEGSTLGSDVAFSPDSRHMAYWGCGGSELNCGVYIHDLETGINRKINHLPNSGYFVWKPDSTQLALVSLNLDAGSDSGLSTWVVDVNTGVAVFNQANDWRGVIEPAGSPTQDWGVEFPPEASSLEGCTLPTH